MATDPDVLALQDKVKWLILYKNDTVSKLASLSGQVNDVQSTLASPMVISLENNQLVVKPQQS